MGVDHKGRAGDTSTAPGEGTDISSLSHSSLPLLSLLSFLLLILSHTFHSPASTRSLNYLQLSTLPNLISFPQVASSSGTTFSFSSPGKLLFGLQNPFEIAL